MSIEIPEDLCAPKGDVSFEEKVAPLPEEIARQLSPSLLPDDVPSEALIAAIEAEQKYCPRPTDVVSQHFRLGSLFWDLAQSLSGSAPEDTAYYADQACDYLEAAASDEGLSKAKLDAGYLLAYGNAFRFRWEPKVPKAVIDGLLENLVGIASNVPEPVKAPSSSGQVETSRIGIHLLDAVHNTLTFPAGARELVLLHGLEVVSEEFRRESHVQYVIDQQNNCKMPHRNKRYNNRTDWDRLVVSDFIGLADKVINRFIPGEANTRADAGHLALTWLREKAEGKRLSTDQKAVIKGMRDLLLHKRHLWRMRNIS